MNKNLTSLALITLLGLNSFGSNVEAKVKLHSIGDSTMQTYDESSEKRGWGQMLQQFFDSEFITVNNRGKSGASSKSFYQESAYWPTMVAPKSSATTIEEGDYVIIQFAHNDEKNEGADGDTVKAYYNYIGDATTAASTDYRGTTPYGTFKGFIRNFINETKARGGKPIIVTPICRKYFSGNTIRRNGMHDLGDKFTICDGQSYKTDNSVPASDNTYDYAQSLIDVAAEYEDVPVIDLTQLTAELYLSYGEQYCTENLFCSSDNTHTIALGATLIARTFAQAVKNGENMITKATNYNADNKAKSDAILAELAEHVIVSNEITFNPQSGDLGKGYNGQTLTKEFNISAFGLANESGTFTFTTTGDFLVSADKENFGQTAEVSYTGSNLITSVYIRVQLNGTGTVNGTLTASDGTNEKTLELSASIIALGGETEECSVLWAMNGGNSSVTEGAIEAIDQTWSSMYARDYNNINSKAVWPEESGYDATRKVQRNCTLEDSWPEGEIDEVSTRFIQLGVKAPAQTLINLDKISMYVAGAGGSGMRCKVYYDTDSLFSSPTQIADFSDGMAGNTAYLVESSIVESIEDGGCLYIRVYPWYNGGAANAKTICLADVYVHGFAQASSVSIPDATLTWAFNGGDADQHPEYDPFEASAYFKNDVITLGEELAFNGTKSWSGSTGNATFTSIICTMEKGTNNSSAPCDANTLTFSIDLTNGGVFIPQKLSFDAARFGTDGGKWQVAVCAGDDELILDKDFTPNRSGKDMELSQYSYDINGLSADEESPLKLKFSIYSLGGTKDHGLANVVLTGTVMGNSDDSKLEIQSISPETGENISRSGRIVVNYNARIAQGDGEITLTNNASGETKAITPTWSNRALTINYSGLDYGTSYMLSIPEGYVVDAATGNKKAPALNYAMNVIERPVPSPRSFNAIVDASLKQLDYRDKIEATEDMPAQYRTIQAAIDDAPSKSTEPYLIYIKEGTYRDPNFTFSSGYGTRYTDPENNDGTETTRINNAGINEYDSCRLVYVNKPNIHLIGQDRDKVIISGDRLDGSTKTDHSRVWYHISAGATLEVQAGGTDFYMEGCTVDNENWTIGQMAGPQALAMNISADRAVFNNVRTRSYQDTYYNGGTYNRTFWNNSEIEGSVDFIYGDGDVFFDNCLLNINRPSGGFIVAPSHPAETRWGYVFNNTTITTDDVEDPSRYSVWFGRPWHNNPKTVFLHTQCEVSTNDSIWFDHMGGLPAIWAVYDMWNAKGNQMSTVSRKCYYYTDDAGNKIWGAAKNELTAEEAAEYTITNVFSGDKSNNASGYWNPQTYVDKPATPKLNAVGTDISWTADKYAVCYVVTVNDTPVAFPTECKYTAQAGDVVKVQSVGEHGTLSDLSEPITISGDGISDIHQEEKNVSTSYDLLGRKVNEPSTHGIFIVKGQKVIK